jgi:hypothetical protein
MGHNNEWPLLWPLVVVPQHVMDYLLLSAKHGPKIEAVI